MLHTHRIVKSTKFILWNKKNEIVAVKVGFKNRARGQTSGFDTAKKKINANRASASGSSVHIAG